jgi:TonB family protein
MLRNAKCQLFAVMVVGLLPAGAAAQEAIPNTAILDSLDGSSAGEAAGIAYVPLGGATPGRRGASFSRTVESRIEYTRGIPDEGTLEWWIKVEGAEQDRVLILSADSKKLLVSGNGDVSFSGGLAAKATPLRFNSWHAIGLSYGSLGTGIMVDGKVVARASTRTATPASLRVGGFTGTVALFRACDVQDDWYLARGVTADFRQPTYIYRPGNWVSDPVVTYKVDPEYSQGVQGTVVLEVTINASGQATDFNVLKPLGRGLDEKAIEAVRQWRFTPGKKAGKPVPVFFTVEVNFRH